MRQWINKKIERKMDRQMNAETSEKKFSRVESKTSLQQNSTNKGRTNYRNRKITIWKPC